MSETLSTTSGLPENREDVGVIVGRFQTPELHEGHIVLINEVSIRHKRLVVFLGVSPNKRSRKDPLDFDARRLMILESYPLTAVYPITDVGNDDKIWSTNLDSKIKEMLPFASVRLYGGRDSFIAHYLGSLPTTEIESTIYRSATALRDEAGHDLKADAKWRAGVIYGAYNQFPKTWQTVDVAPIRSTNGTVEVLLARKPNEKDWRFIGGFADPRDSSLEMTGRREVMEEAHINVEGFKYICSTRVDDWRYRDDVDKVLTTFFAATYVSGTPSPDDDICELAWFSVRKSDPRSLRHVNIVSAHAPLYAALMNYLKGE